MRSIRVRLLLMLLALVTVVIGGLSWFVYERINLLLWEKEMAMTQLLESQYRKRCDNYKEDFHEKMVHQAERLGRQAYEKVELLSHVTKLHATNAAGTLAAMIAGCDQGIYMIPAMAHSLNNSNRLNFQLYTKRTIIVEDRALDGDEYFHIWTPLASTRSPNLPDDCFVKHPIRTSALQLYKPEVQEEVLKCGKQFCMVTMRMPIAYVPMLSGTMELGRPQPNRGRFTTLRSSGPGMQPIPSNSIIIQIARETDVRDKMLSTFRDEANREILALRKESEQIRKDTLNRLILICMGTICLCALAITWVSRVSLAPLVNVADAVTDLQPKDLKLKLKGTELDPKKLPEELSPIVQRLQESLESLDAAFLREKRATADISHELRTPLASLMTTAQVALRKQRTSDEYRATLKQCVETGSHMTTLVERLLVLSRLDAGVDPLKKEPTDIVELVGTCVDMLRPLADQREISIEMEVDASASNLEPILSDRSKLREVLVNLLDNAVNYNKDQGQVTLRVSAATKSIVLEVVDTGVGMSPETQAHLFERFFRADPSRQSESVNAGLGLAIVKGYVDLFGGTISVASVPGEGSTFRVTLPRASSPTLVPA